MRSNITSALPKPPRVHLFWPNGDIHQKGLNRMLAYVEENGFSDMENLNVPYYQRIIHPEFDTEGLSAEEDYVLIKRRIKVSSLKELSYKDYRGFSD